MFRRTGAGRILGIVVGLLALALTGTASAARRPSAARRHRHVRSSPAATGLTIRSLSVRADLVSGPQDVLEVTLPRGAHASAATLRLNRTVVPAALHAAPAQTLWPTPARTAYLAELTALHLGRNTVTVTAGRATAALVIEDHVVGAPLFSGPQSEPWQCTTSSNGLGAAVDQYCNAPEKTRYYYMPAGLAGVSTPDVGLVYPSSGFLPYNASAPPPRAAIATVMTDSGQVVPYIVRYEVGTVNRGIYDQAILATPGQAATPWSPLPGWDHTVTYLFGGGCGLDYNQGTDSGQNGTGITPAFSLYNAALGRGQAVVWASTSSSGENCQTVVGAETVMEAEEHLTDEYGPIRFTESYGCSGGSIMPTQIADAYPGLINGLITHCSYSDLFNPLLFGVMDCSLLQHYFTGGGGLAGLTLTPIQEAEIEGEVLGDVNCAAEESGTLFPSFGTTGSCAGSGSYSASNPHGVQCDLFTRFVNELGRNAEGVVNRPADNIGVQYGLVPLEKGEITPAQFAALNAGVGGISPNGGYQAARTEGSLVGIRRMYQDDLIMYGRQLGNVPDIDARADWQNDMHDNSQWMFTRNRLLAHNGNANNQIHWFQQTPDAFGMPDSSLIAQSRTDLGQWLDAITADPRTNLSAAAKATADKPAGLQDECFLTSGQAVPWTADSQCTRIFSYAGDARMAAGGPDTNFVIKCQLKPLVASDYTVTFTAAEWAQLQKAFPTGVCDYSKPGVEEQPPKAAWLSFQSGPGGVPLGPAPVSHAVTRRRP